jgi:hypothetical protein
VINGEEDWRDLKNSELWQNGKSFDVWLMTEAEEIRGNDGSLIFKPFDVYATTTKSALTAGLDRTKWVR